MKKLLPYLFSIFLLPFTLTGQPINNHLQDVTMPPPNASSLGKYGDVPVSYSTGIPNVGIPIYTLHEGTLSLPISLSYHAGGIRPGEISSWVGAGWSLQAGGIISRTIQGTADEQAHGYLSRNQDITFEQVLNDENQLVTCVNHLDDPTPIVDMANGQLDGEPDIFTFTAGGYNGKFHFDVNDEIVLVPKQDLKILYENDGNLSSTSLRSFTIILPDGTKYRFGEKPNGDRIADMSRVNNSLFVDQVSWYLTQIESYDGEHLIEFTYREEKYRYNTRSYTGGGGTVGGRTVNYTDIEGFQLSQIQTSVNTVYFNPGNNRADVQSNFPGSEAKLLGDIEIKSANVDFCKKIDLDIGYFYDDTNQQSGTPEDYRPRLNTLTESSCVASHPINDIPPYIFEYHEDKINPTFFPTRLTLAIDHWGYYNGAHDNSGLNIPFTKINFTGPLGEEEFCAGESDRETNELYMKYGTIKSIEYPTGGKTIFDFEANTYFESEGIPDLQLIDVTSDEKCTSEPTAVLPGISFTANNLDKLRYTWKYGEGDPTFCIDPIASPKIEVWKNGVLHSSATSGFTQGDENRALSDLLPSLQEGEDYVLILILTYAYSKFELLEEVLIAENTNRDVGGLRISQLTNRGEIGGGNDKDVIKTYSYEDANINSRSSGQLFSYPDYASIVRFSSTPCGNNPNQSNGIAHFFTDVSITPLHSFEGRHLVYANVKEHLNGIGYNQYQFFTEALPPDPSLNGNGQTEFFPRPPVQAMIEAGKTSLTAARKDNNVEVAYSTNEKFADSYEMSDGIYVKAAFIPNPNSNSLANFVTYRIRSKPFRLAKVTSVLDGVSTEQTYDYTSSTHLAPTITTITNSNEEVTRTETIYSFDAYHSIDPEFDDNVRDKMEEYNILVPFKTEISVDGVANMTDGSRTDWSLFNTYPYPTKFNRYEATWDNNGVLSGSWEEKAVVGSYQNGLPTSYTREGWDPEIYTWTASGQIDSKTFKDFTWDYNYFPNTRLLSSIIEPDGQEVFYEYDAIMRLKKNKARNDNIVTDYTYTYGDINNPSSVSTTTTFAASTDSELTSLTTTQYVDGLGRSIQLIRHDYSEAEKDIVETTEYDQWGRPNIVYEPFEVNNAGNNGDYVSTVVGNPGFTTTTFDDTPLSRTIAVTPPDWYATNYLYGNNANMITTPDGVNYAAGSLNKKTVIDPNGNQIESYVDKLGRSILSRRLDDNDNVLTNTFTEYDDKNRMITVFPPGSSTATPDLIYKYLYDGEDNVTAKKVPGRDVLPGEDFCQKYWYDTRNLLTFTEHSSIPAAFNFEAFYYDEYGRMRKHGFVTAAPPNNGATFNNTIPNANLLATESYGTSGITLTRVEAREARVITESGLGAMFAYTHSYDPYGRLTTISNNHLLNISDFTAQQINYDYDFADNITKEEYQHNIAGDILQSINRSVIDHSGRPFQHFHQITYNNLAYEEVQVSELSYTEKDQIEQEHLGKTQTGFLQSVDYTYLTNGFLSGINDPTNLQGDLFALSLGYDQPAANAGVGAQLNGNISSLVSRVEGSQHFTNGYTYNGLNRLLSSSYVAQNGPAQDDAYNTSYTYDSRGNIITLNRAGHSEEVYGSIDELDYTYAANSNQLQRVTDNVQLPLHAAGYTALEPASDYTYDAAGNMTYDPAKDMTVIYNYLNLPSSFTLPNDRQYEYIYLADGTKLRENILDENSNVLSKRDYLGPTQYVEDELQLVMHPNGRVTFTLPMVGNNDCPPVNQVTQVVDPISVFRGGEVKSAINLPTSEEVYFVGETAVTLEPGFEVPAGMTFTAEIQPCANSGLEYQYFLSDHLGNTRITFADINADGNVGANEILTENHYYAFGLEMSGNWGRRTDTEQRYRFNGIEHEEIVGLDLAPFRAYDPAIGRWLQSDPMAELRPDLTPYRFGFNNPIAFSDPFGLFETRDDAKAYAKEQGIKTGWLRKNKIKKQKDGSFAIENKTSSTQKTKDATLITDLGLTADEDGGAIVTSALTKAPSKVINNVNAPQKVAPMSFLEGFTSKGVVGNGRYNNDGYLIGAAPNVFKMPELMTLASPAGAVGVAKFGGLALAGSGILRLPKAWIGMRVVMGGSKNTLAYTALIYKIRAAKGLPNGFGVIKGWTPFGTANIPATFYGRWAAAGAIGGGTVTAGAGFFYERQIGKDN